MAKKKITKLAKGLAGGAFKTAAMATAVIGIGSIIENRIAAEGFLTGAQMKADKIKNKLHKPKK